MYESNDIFALFQFAKMVFAAKPNLVVYGNLCDTPRLDELLSGITLK